MARVNTGSGWTLTSRALQDGAGTVINTATANIAKVDLASDIALTGSVKAANGPIRTSARLATIAALPACTYNNGALGIGATLTGNANGQIADIDYVTPAVNDRILVTLQAAPLQNGIYVVTQLGDAGTPFVLTRAATADVDAEYAAGVLVDVSEGTNMSGVSFISRPTPTVTVGTSTIRFDGIRRPMVTPSDVLYGTNRAERRYTLDFEEVPSAITTTSTVIPGTPATVSLSGTGAQAVQAGSGEVLPGVIDMQTGTTAAGYCDFQVSSGPFTFDTAKPTLMCARLKIPTLSDGTNTFLIRVGFMPALALGAAGTLAAGMFFQARSLTNWEAVCAHGSVSNGTSPNGVDTGIAQVGAVYRAFYIVYDPVAAAAKFYIGAALVATVTTNLPAGDAIGIGATIFKQAGTTSRDLFVDFFSCIVPDGRLPAMTV